MDKRRLDSVVISASYILHHLCFQNICNLKKKCFKGWGQRCWPTFAEFFFSGNASYRKHVIRQITHCAISTLLLPNDERVKLSVTNRKFTCQTFWQRMKSRVANDRLACQHLTQPCFFKVNLSFTARLFFSWRLKDQLDLRYVMKKTINLNCALQIQINVLLHRRGFAKEEPSGAQWSGERMADRKRSQMTSK